jgi:hypothetical protein
MAEDFQLEVVNDIAVILRIQGQEFQAAEIYEPLNSGRISITNQQIVAHLQDKGAAVVGKMLAQTLKDVVDSELGRRLQRDKWLVAVIAAMTRNLGKKKVAESFAIPTTEVGLVPEDHEGERERKRGVRGLIHSAVAEVERVNQRREIF